MKKKRTLVDEKIDKILQKAPVEYRPIGELLADISNHAGMKKLFHSMKDDVTLGRVFFLHPVDLFGKEGRYQPPYLYYGKHTGKSDISRALKTLRIDFKARSSAGIPFLTKALGISEQEQESLGRDVIDALLYALVTFFRVSPPLRDLVNAETFSYRALRETVKDYADIIDEDEAEHVLSAILGDEPADPEVANLIERILLALIPLATKKSLELLELTKASASEIAIASHQAAISYLNGLLEKARMSFEDYTELVKQLYLFELVENQHSISWCEKCSERRIGYSEHHGPRPPARMLGLRCAECGEEESFSTVYAVDPLLLQSVFSRNNFLGVYTVWYLSDAGHSPEVGLFVDDKETDIIVGDTLIECKTYRAGGRPEGGLQNLEASIKQMQGQISALLESGREIERGILLVNQPEVKDHLPEVVSKIGMIIENLNIEVCDCTDLGRIAESL